MRGRRDGCASACRVPPRARPPPAGRASHARLPPAPAGGIAITATNFGSLITGLYCFGLFLGTIYSVPPLRLKRSAVAAFMIIATGGGVGRRGSTGWGQPPAQQRPTSSQLRARPAPQQAAAVGQPPTRRPPRFPTLCVAVRGFLLNFGVYHAARAALGLPFAWNPSIRWGLVGVGVVYGSTNIVAGGALPFVSIGPCPLCHAVQGHTTRPACAPAKPCPPGSPLHRARPAPPCRWCAASSPRL